MDNFYDKLLERKTDIRKNTVWYSAGMLIFSASSVILLLVVTRVLGDVQAGIFSIGWAVCQQMLTIGYFGSRNFQVADVRQKYSFQDYLSSKVITIIIMFVGAVIYSLILGMNAEKFLVSLLLTLLMSAEVFADIFAGFLQLNFKLELSGKSYVIRVIGYDAIFIFSLIFMKNLTISLLLACLFSYVWLVFFDYQLARRLNTNREKINIQKITKLLLLSFPIFISAFLTNYLINIPKNSIEIFYPSQFQTIYNVIFMPASIITMFIAFILVPMYTTISESWLSNQYLIFKKILSKLIMLIVIISFVVVVGGYFFGIPILSMAYNLNLNDYKTPFILLLIAGGLNSLSTFFVYLLTVFEKQKYLLYIYLSVAVVATFFGNYLVKEFALTGAACAYLLSVGIVDLCLLVIIVLHIKRIGTKL
jgi:O-antigen/teichoic acid export membrane protein